ncbi:MAG: MerR family transcriptional regulator [Myxococcales bacterium]|nr:MerR family transcriptional regulator [Myxococcales bacterium]MCB9651056.1 MerR family transcriptional regulator [Deltaproteobacteria bacterium]
MALSSRQLQDIERAYSEGLSSKEIIQVLGEHGEPLSEATLRKYVQLGLLPRSRRVGQKGKHRGSRGIYPVEVIRRVDEIRRAMEQGDTLESLARAAQATRAKLSSVRVALDEALDAAEVDFGGRELDRRARAALKAELGALRKGAKDWLKAVDRWMGEVEQAERSGAKAAGATNGRAVATRGRRGVV